MTEDQIIEEVLSREGWNGPGFVTPGDRGGRTAWGISEEAHPEAWALGPPTRDAAREIYRNEYVKPWAWIPDQRVRVFVIDWFVNSSPRVVIRALQEAVGADVDGQVGPQTRFKMLQATETGQPVFNRLAASRAEHFLRLALDEPQTQKFIQDNPHLQLRFLRGWIRNRVLDFLKETDHAGA